MDKVRIVESLRRRGHTVAMTGDGVNDAPAVRLADVGVAMGLSGTEAARQTADVVLADDEFARLAEALVEGRSFWRNMRHALGLLLGGNAGEMGLYVGATCAGLRGTAEPDANPPGKPHHRRPAVPDHCDAAAPAAQSLTLAREGLAGLDASLPSDTLRRGLSTGVPTLGAYFWARTVLGPAEAGAVAFASIICTQLAETLDAGASQGMLSRSVFGAVGGSLAALGFALGVPPVRDLFGLAAPSAAGWGAVAAASAAAVALSRTVSLAGSIQLQKWLPAWTAELRRLAAARQRLLPALPAPA